MVGIVMFVPALIAAELLIFPAVNDFVTTFKTSRLSFLLIFPVIHIQNITPQISKSRQVRTRSKISFFLFLMKIISFSDVSETDRKILSHTK